MKKAGPRRKREPARTLPLRSVRRFVLTGIAVFEPSQKGTAHGLSDGGAVVLVLPNAETVSRDDRVRLLATVIRHQHAGRLASAGRPISYNRITDLVSVYGRYINLS